MKVVLSYSGGLDSTVLLYALRAQGHDVSCLSVHYGQRHSKELEVGRLITAMLGVKHRVADLRAVRELLAGSSQTSEDVPVPEGHYSDESMKQTVVPNRNMLLLSLATAWAVSTKSDAVAYAAHAGDHAIYPDCRKEFADKMEEAIALCDWHSVRLLRPFLLKTKADICKLGSELGVPFHLTWSCYKGGEKHCGKCGTCYERREAFQLSRVQDPTEYL